MTNVAKADPSPPFAGGSGTSSDPYIIMTAEQLNSIRDAVDKSFKLGADIDLTAFLSASGAGYNSGKGWMPIGSNPAFTGTLDGNGHTITGLFISRPGGNNQGLFGIVGAGGQLLNIALKNVDVTGGYIAGGLVASNKGTVENSYVTGSVAGKSDPMGMGMPSIIQSTGGLAGENSGAIIHSYSRGTVKGDNMVGGLVGENRGTVSSSASTAAVDGRDRTGGLVGQNNGHKSPGFIGLVQNSYATGSVTSAYASQYSSIGGLIGICFDGAEVINSYAAVTINVPSAARTGGLIGYIADHTHSSPGDASMYPNTTIVTSSYWDTEKSGIGTSIEGTGKTTAQMNTQGTFAGWDFTNLWQMAGGKNDGYPYIFEFPPDKTAASGLTVTSSDAAGAGNDGKTILAVTPSVAAGNKLQYKNFGSATVTVPFEGDPLTDYTDLPSGGVVTAVNGDHIGVAEVDGSNVVIKFGHTTAVVANEPKTYTIETVSDQTLTGMTIGYSAGSQETKSITVTRTGTGDLLHLSVSLSGTHAGRFAISQPTATTLDAATTSTVFTVSAKDGLAAGTYTATVTIAADSMTSATFQVTQQVLQLKGDANGDGAVTPADALIINKYLKGLVTLTEEQKLILDMNDDGKIDAVDAKMILDVYTSKGA